MFAELISFGRKLAVAAVAVAGIAWGSARGGDTIYWNGTGNDWTNWADWSSLSVPGTADTAVFSIGTLTVPTTANLNANQSVLGLQFGGSQYTAGVGAITIQSGTVGNTLTIGSGGILHSTWTGAGDNIKADVVLGADQTWTTGSAPFTVSGAVSGAANLTIAGNNQVIVTGNTNINGNLTISGGATLTMQQAGSTYAFNTLSVTGTFNAIQASLNPVNTTVTLNQDGRIATTGAINSGLNVNIAGAGWSSYLSNNDNANTATYSGTIAQLNPSMYLEAGGSGTIVFAGTTDNAGLAMWARGNHTTVLAKASSPTVHALNGDLQISDGTVQIGGTGDYQMNPTGSINLSYNDGKLDLNGRNLTINRLLGGNTTVSLTNTAASTSSILTVGYNNGTDTFNGNVQDGAAGSGAIGITKVGTGSQTFAGSAVTINYSGATTVGAGTLNFSAANVAMSGAMTVNGGTLQFSGTGANTSGPIAVNSGGTLTYSGFGNVSTSAITAKPGAVIQSDSSTNAAATLANSFSPNSDVVLNGSSLIVKGHTSGDATAVTGDFTSGSNFVHNVVTTGLTVGQTITVPAGYLPDGATTTTINGFWDGGMTIQYNLGGALLTGTGVTITPAAVSYTTSQSVKSLSLSSGSSTVSATNFGIGSNNTSGSTVLNLNGITRNIGATVDFTLPGGAQSSANGITATNANTAASILGGWATVAMKDWAVSAGNGTTAGNITALGSYDLNAWGSGKNTDVSSRIVTFSDAATNSLRFDAAGNNTLTLPAGTKVIASGGILVTGANAATKVPVIAGGSLTAGNGTGLIVHQYNATNPLTIAATIVDASGTTSIGLSKAGTGSLVLTAANSYTGATNINAGTVTVSNTGTLGSNSAVTLSGSGNLAFTNVGGQINLQTIGATATASTALRPASWAIDGNLNDPSRWASSESDPQWIYVDLKGVYNLSSVKISWETAGAKDFVLQTANSNATNPDGTNANGWTTVGTVTNQASYTDKHYITYNLSSGASGSYLAMYGTARNTGWGYSIWEMQLFQAAGPVTQSIGSLQSSDATTSVSLDNQVNLNAGGDNSSTTFAGAVTGGGSLTKAGGGILTLSGVNTYAGNTTVNAGTLRFTGSARNTSSAAVVAGATLDLARADNLSVLAATIPVTNDGLLNVIAAAQELGRLSGTGDTSVAAGAGLTANSIVQGTLSIGAGGTVTIRETTGGAVNAVPEPSTLALLIAGLAGLLAFTRRRRTA